MGLAASVLNYCANDVCYVYKCITVTCITITDSIIEFILTIAIHVHVMKISIRVCLLKIENLK